MTSGLAEWAVITVGVPRIAADLAALHKSAALGQKATSAARSALSRIPILRVYGLSIKKLILGCFVPGSCSGSLRATPLPEALSGAGIRAATSSVSPLKMIASPSTKMAW